MTMLTRTIRRLHMGRMVPELNPDIKQDVASKTVLPKYLPTRRKLGSVHLPVRLEMAARNKIEQMATKELRRDAAMLMSVMKNIKMPDDEEVLARKKADVLLELELRDKISTYPQDEKYEEAKMTAREELNRLVTGTLENRRRDWHYYEYDDYASALYMGVRLAPNYGCVRTVMKELHDLDPTFEPKSVLDFGSGMGTTIWAVNETWPDTVNEFTNVDLSKDQQSLCEYLLRGGKEHGPSIPGLFYRQYLPAVNKMQYNMVVSAYTLLELPSGRSRTQTIENLWHLTDDVLVLVERGNKAGFQAINEARHFLLDKGGHDVTKKVRFTLESRPQAKLYLPKNYVFSPCPHEFACPKLTAPSKQMLDVCRFRISYEPFHIIPKLPGMLKEEFSYVILRKGAHPSYFNTDFNRWPRCIARRNKASGALTFKVCCSNGQMAETVITKKRYGTELYEIAKKSDWGDILPVRMSDTYMTASERQMQEKVDKNTESSQSGEAHDDNDDTKNK